MQQVSSTAVKTVRTCLAEIARTKEIRRHTATTWIGANDLAANRVSIIAGQATVDLITGDQ